MIKLPATFMRFGSKSDGSASLSFCTQELQAEDFVAFKNAQNQFGWLVFQENDINARDIPSEQAEDKQKTPSKRMRATLFVLWKQQGSQGDFEVYYREKVEKYIEFIKSKLD